MTISNAITETVQSHVYELQYIDNSRLRGPRLSSVLEYARAVGAGGGGVGVGGGSLSPPRSGRPRRRSWPGQGRWGSQTLGASWA